nr:hypothetical protein [Cohnella lubricantis]
MTLIIEKNKRRVTAKLPLSGVRRVVVVINHQFTNSPNTTQIASGAGRSSAAGNNAAINSPKAQQQQSVGADGTAVNKELAGFKRIKGRPSATPLLYRPQPGSGQEVVIVLNDQIVKLPKRSRNASATQVASGGGVFSTGGTNSAIESAASKQQHAVGGGGKAVNKRISKRIKGRG